METILVPGENALLAEEPALNPIRRKDRSVSFRSVSLQKGALFQGLGAYESHSGLVHSLFPTLVTQVSDTSQIRLRPKVTLDTVFGEKNFEAEYALQTTVKGKPVLITGPTTDNGLERLVKAGKAFDRYEELRKNQQRYFNLTSHIVTPLIGAIAGLTYWVGVRDGSIDSAMGEWHDGLMVGTVATIILYGGFRAIEHGLRKKDSDYQGLLGAKLSDLSTTTTPFFVQENAAMHTMTAMTQAFQFYTADRIMRSEDAEIPAEQATKVLTLLNTYRSQGLDRVSHDTWASELPSDSTINAFRTIHDGRTPIVQDFADLFGIPKLSEEHVRGNPELGFTLKGIN